MPILLIMMVRKRDIGSLPLFQTGVFEPLPDQPIVCPTGPDHAFERFLRDQGHRYIAGTDEAGRGPLAGPVVAAAVILPFDVEINGLDDSKKLAATKREALFEQVMSVATAVSVASISAQTIDSHDIRKCSLEAMRRCLASLYVKPDAVLVDGRDIPPALPPSLRAHALIKGDGRSMSIAAAAIVAKVTRDRMMKNLAGIHQEYGFDRHMGYGSALHRHQIEACGGINRVHRFSFRPLKVE